MGEEEDRVEKLWQHCQCRICGKPYPRGQRCLRPQCVQEKKWGWPKATMRDPFDFRT